MTDKNIEVELRGPLTQEKYRELVDFFDKEGKFKEDKDRVIIDYSSFMPGEGLMGRNKDIRLRVTNGRPEIIIKIGKWSGTDDREEVSVYAEKGSFDNLVKIFALLGMTKGVLAIRKIKVFDYREIEFSLVDLNGYGYSFEAEKMVEGGHDREATKEEIKKVCLDLGLKLFSDQEFSDFITDLNKNINEVFDYDNYQKDYFKNRFGL